MSTKKEEVKEALLSSQGPDSSQKKVEPQKKEKKADTTWGDGGSKHFGLWYFTKFTIPFMWKGGWFIKIQTILTFLCLILSRAFNVMHPAVLGMTVNAIVCIGEKQADCPTPEEVYYLVGLYALLKFLADFVKYICEVPFANVSASSEVFIASMVYKHIQDQSLSFHLNRETGKIVRVVSRGSTSFASILRMLVFQLLPLILELTFVLAIIAYLFPWEFVAIVFGSLVLYVMLTYIVTEWRAKFFKAMIMKDAEYNQKATDSLLNFETVKYFNAEEHEEQRFKKSLMQYKTANVTVAKSLVTLNVVQAVCISLGLAVNLLMSFSKIQSGDMNVGDFVSLNAYILQMYIPLSFLGTMWRFIRQSMVDVELIFELLGVHEQTVNQVEQVGKHFEKGQIEFRNVSFSYDRPDVPEEERKMIIENLSFTVPAGKTVALVGSTGSGKSTIMRLLYRFYEINEGQILIDGEDIKQMHINDLRRNIAIVPQDCVLFNDTIRYNIAYGGVNDADMKELIDDDSKAAALEEKIIPAAKRAQIHGFVEEKHKKYGEKVGERGLKLSGGEKQRVAIARALLKRTPIMCFDEATSALDTETEREIQKAIDEVSKGATSIIIAHRLSTVRNADIIIVLKHGVIVEQGSHDELLSVEHGHYKSLWEKQNADDELQRQRERLRAAEEEELAAALRERAEARASMKKSQRGDRPAIN